MNIRSLCKHRLELQVLLQQVGTPFDIIALSEIGRNNLKNCATFFHEYEFFFHSPTSKCGGTALFIRKGIEIKTERNDLKLQESHNSDCNYGVENNWVEIKLKEFKSNIIIGCVYRHPKGKISVFQDQLEKSLQKIDKENKICFLVGDLNINALSTSHVQTQNFFNSMLSQNYIPHITLPTRITDTSATLIDHIFVKYNCDIIDEAIISGNIFSDISDHLPNFILFGEKSVDNTKVLRPSVRILSEKNISKFKEYLSELKWEELFYEKNASENFDILSERLNYGFDKCFPLKKLSKKRSKDKKWITPGIRISSNTKNKIFRQLLVKKNDNLRSKYKMYKKILYKVCREAEANYFSSLLIDTKNSVKKLWDILGPMIKPDKSRKNKNFINKLVFGDKVITDDTSIANTFNEYFVSIGHNLASQIPPNAKHYKDYLGTEMKNGMFLFPTSAEEVSKFVLNLNGRKTSGPDCVPTKIVKACHQELANPLSSIFNQSFESGIFPEGMKIAMVIPLHKKNEKFIPGNYRPISLLNIFGKILEKIMHKRLYSFLIKFNILYPLQFGFRTNHSTSLALLDIMERVHDSLDKGNLVLGLYIDLQKAFDTVNHTILLDKLSHYGIRGTVNKWFKSYLSDRSQYVSVNGVKSCKQPVCMGVPQGSVLGPLLFLIYVNDIAKAISDSSVTTMLFADDTNIFIENKDSGVLMAKAKKSLQELHDWFCSNKLSLNIEKTQYSIFRTVNKSIPPECDNIMFRNTHIERVENCKYLGVILDDKLNWNSHIQSITNSLVKISSAFKLINHIVPTKFRFDLYYAYVYSKLAYGIEVYGHASNTSMKCLQVQQNRILKILFKKDWYTNTNLLHSTLNILKVKDIFRLQLVNFIFKQQKKLTPKVFDNYFELNSNIHTHNTRQLKQIHVKKTKKKIGEKTVKYTGAILYNNLPDHVSFNQSVKGFRKKVKQHFIDQYETH